MVDALLQSGRLQKDDEVLVPALAWPTTVWPLAQLGLVPVFVDVDPKTLAIDLDSAERALGSQTKGMFLIHVLGQAADLPMYQKFCVKHGLVLLEDVCESLGAHSYGSHAGTFGRMGSFSFYFSHHLSTVEGGMIVTSHDGDANNLRSLRAHGWIRDRSDRTEWAQGYPKIDDRFLFIMPGYNVRPMEIQGAIGSVQLARLDDMLKARESLVRKVNEWVWRYTPWLELIGSEHLAAPPDRYARRHSWMTMPFRLRDTAPIHLWEVKQRLQESGVETRPIIAGNLARHPAVDCIPHRQSVSLTVSDTLLRRGFMIGCHPIVEPGALNTLERAFAQLGCP
jgi:CDP-6-deoxy-D-xylo-4-hexulose-3-dehydrase